MLSYGRGVRRSRVYTRTHSHTHARRRAHEHMQSAVYIAEIRGHARTHTALVYIMFEYTCAEHIQSGDMSLHRTCVCVCFIFFSARTVLLHILARACARPFNGFNVHTLFKTVYSVFHTNTQAMRMCHHRLAGGVLLSMCAAAAAPTNTFVFVSWPSLPVNCARFCDSQMSRNLLLRIRIFQAFGAA